MNKEIEQFRDTLDKQTGDGRDIERARALSDAYINAHPEQFDDYRDMDEAACAQAADVFRAAGMDEPYWRVEMWVRSTFEPQEIGGQVAAQRRSIPAASTGKKG